MTVADLPRLTPRQRLVAELHLSGLSPSHIVKKLGGRWSRNNVDVALWQARHRLKTGFVPRQPGDACRLGHAKTLVGKRYRCKICVAAARKRLATRDVLEPVEQARDARTRIQREVVEGKRCKWCWLLVSPPCGCTRSKREGRGK